jgi:hypothetical protein
MRIIKSPQFDICECKICGTIFQPEVWDELHYKFEPADFVNFEVFTPCPTCSQFVKVTTKK